MKLFWPAASSAALPSVWDAATYPIDSDAAETSRVSQLADNKVLPFYLLSTNPQAAGTIQFTGSEIYSPAAASRDYCWKQLAVFGIPIAAPGGVIPYNYVFSPSFLATSCVSTQWYNGSGIAGTGFFSMFVYVYRPSTQSVVGYLAKPKAGRWRNTAYYAISHVRPAGAGGSGNGTQWNTWLTEYYRNLNFDRANITAQAGDYVCYEMWGYSTTYAVTGTVQNPIHWQVDFDVGGTTPQAWTYQSTTLHNGTSFFFWDDLSSPVGLVPGFPYDPTPVNLINVDPGTGPRLSLGFDGPVGITGPTLGPASSGLGVTGATQVDATHIDLATDYPPTHPIGEATEDTPPAPPTGGGAFLL